MGFGTYGISKMHTRIKVEGRRMKNGRRGNESGNVSERRVGVTSLWLLPLRTWTRCQKEMCGCERAERCAACIIIKMSEARK